MVDRSVCAASRALVPLVSALLQTGFAAAAEPPALGPCGAPSTRIHEIQGEGRSSPLLGATGVTVEAVVVGLFPGLPEGLGGLFVQEEDGDTDLDPLTSEGIFVFAPDLDPALELQLGDVVRLRGEVQEFFGMTELAGIGAMARCPVAGIATPLDLVLPVAAVDASEPSYWERWEGMLVRFAQPLFVVDQYAAGRFGEVGLSAGGRPWQATQHVVPGAGALAWHADDDRSRILH